MENILLSTKKMDKVSKILNAIDGFLNEKGCYNFAINCETEEDAKNLLEALSETKRQWYNGEKIVSEIGEILTKWNKFKNNTCYRFFVDKEEVMSARKAFYEKKDVNIITFSDLMRKYLIENDKDEKKNLTSKNELLNTMEVAENEKNSANMVEINEENNVSENLVEKTESGNIFESILQEVESSDVKYEEKQNNEVFNSINTFSKDNHKIEKINFNDYFGLKLLQPFKINTNHNNTLNHNANYRFTVNNIRQKQIDDDSWTNCNNEAELLYLINNPCIVVGI